MSLSRSSDQAAPSGLDRLPSGVFSKGMKRMPHYREAFDQSYKTGVNAVLNDYERATRPAVCRSYPPLLNIAITDTCNLGCVHCPRTHDGTIDLSELSFEHVRSVVDHIGPYATDIQVSGGLGEPLLYDELFDTIDRAKRYNMNVSMISNGTLIDDEAAEKLLEHDMNHIAISFDGATPETYESIRRGADFDEVIENVRRLCSLRDERGADTRIDMAPVIFAEENLDELDVFLSVAEDTGVDGVRFNDLKQSTPNDLDGISGKSLAEADIDPEYVQRKFDEARREADRRGLYVKFPGDESRCDEPWRMLQVTTKGKVRPGCTCPWGIYMGDIIEEGLDGIWNNERFVEWRRSMTSDNPQQVCKDCQKSIW